MLAIVPRCSVAPLEQAMKGAPIKVEIVTFRTYGVSFNMQTAQTAIFSLCSSKWLRHFRVIKTGISKQNKSYQGLFIATLGPVISLPLEHRNKIYIITWTQNYVLYLRSMKTLLYSYPEENTLISADFSQLCDPYMEW